MRLLTRVYGIFFCAAYIYEAKGFVECTSRLQCLLYCWIAIRYEVSRQQVQHNYIQFIIVVDSKPFILVEYFSYTRCPLM